jgi:hypothetical protein
MRNEVIDMSNGQSAFEEGFSRAMKSKAAIDAYRNLRAFRDLVKAGVDPDTAFLQVFMGIYVLVPKPPRPDTLLLGYPKTVAELTDALKEAHAEFSLLRDEAKEGIEYLKPA